MKITQLNLCTNRRVPWSAPPGTLVISLFLPVTLPLAKHSSITMEIDGHIVRNTYVVTSWVIAAIVASLLLFKNWKSKKAAARQRTEDIIPIKIKSPEASRG